MSSIFASASTYFDSMDWALKKGVESFKTGHLFNLVPVATAAYLAYSSLHHFSTALLGTDSKEFRSKLQEKTFSNKDLSFSQKASAYARYYFGSISLADRLKEASLGAANLLGSIFCLYSLHYFTREGQKPDQNPMNAAGGKEVEHELNPTSAHYDAIQRVKLLNLPGYKENFQDLYAKELSDNTPPPPHVSSFIDSILIPPQPSTAGKLSEFYSNVCDSATTAFGLNSNCFSEKLTVEKMTLHELDEVCENAKKLVQIQAPRDYEGKIASTLKTVCDYTVGFLPKTEGMCESFHNKFHPENTNQAELLEQGLDTLCSTMRAKKLFYHLKPTDPNLKDQEMFFEILKRFKPADTIIVDAPPPKETSSTGLQNWSTSGSSRNATGSIDTKLHNLKNAAANYFDLPPHFKDRDLKRQTRRLKATFHPDKNSNSSQAFLNIEKLNELLNEYPKSMLNTETHAQNATASAPLFDSKDEAFKAPNQVVSDLYNWALNWFKSPPVVQAV